MLCAFISRRRESRELIRAAERFAKGLDPVFLECILQRTHERAFDPRLHVVPMLRILRVARPLFGKTDATGKSHPAIHRQDATM